MSNKFKVGDRIEIINGTGTLREFIGDVGEVIEVDGEEESRCLLHFDNGITNEWYNEIMGDRSRMALVKNKVWKFSVGDKVSYCTNLIGTIGCIHENGVAYMSTCKRRGEGGTTYDFGSGASCAEHRNFMGYHVNELYLIKEESEINNVNVDNKGIMSNIKTFVKNLVLSADEKLLRKYGLKTECGDYTQDAIDAVNQKNCKAEEAYLIEIAKGLEEEAKNDK